MSEPAHEGEEETGQEPQGPGAGWIPVQPSSSPEVPAWTQAGTSPLPPTPRGAFEPPTAPTPASVAAPTPASVAGSAAAPVAATVAGDVADPGAGPTGGRRLAFRSWRRRRPFWGGLLVLLGGGEILLTYHAAFGLVVHFGLYGLAGFMVPAVLVLLGALIIFDPAHRTFYSFLSVIAALGTWLTSNLGGFIVGMLLGVIGGSLAFGWAPGERAERKRSRVRARATG